MPYLSEALDSSHDLSSFDCGKPELDLWLRASALEAGRRGTCRTFVWHNGDRAVVAYYGLAPHVIERADLSRNLGHGSPDRIPAILIARLALDTRLHGQRLGSALLAECFMRISTAVENVGGRFVVVDAIDQK